MSSPLGADGFRALHEVHKPDGRFEDYCTWDRDALEFRPWTLADMHEVIAEYELSAAVPEDVRVQWDTARNVWLYAWHVYRFFPLAERHAFSTFELALKTRLKCEAGGLAKLTNKAIQQGYLPEEKESCVVMEAMRHIRNVYAHGSVMLHPAVEPSFRHCRDLIEQLFSKESG